MQVPLYHPADLAHRVLSLMSVCGDRLTLGVSPGSTETDFATLDRDYATRFATFHRNVGRLRVLLANGRDEHADLAPATVAGRAPPSCSARGAPTSSGPRGTSTAGWPPDTAARRIRSSPPTSATGPPAAGGRSCAPSRWTAGTTSNPPARCSGATQQAGFDDAVVLIGPGGPDPEEVRALLPRPG